MPPVFDPSGMSIADETFTYTVAPAANALGIVRARPVSRSAAARAARSHAAAGPAVAAVERRSRRRRHRVPVRVLELSELVALERGRAGLGRCGREGVDARELRVPVLAIVGEGRRCSEGRVHAHICVCRVVHDDRWGPGVAVRVVAVRGVLPARRRLGLVDDTEGARDDIRRDILR